MKLFLHINAKKIEAIISYFDNHLRKVGIQTIFSSHKKTPQQTVILIIYTVY